MALGALVSAKFSRSPAACPRLAGLAAPQRCRELQPLAWRKGKRHQARWAARALAPAAQALLDALQASQDAHQAAAVAQLAAGLLGQLPASAAAAAATALPPLPPAAWVPLANLATALQPSCFDATCQQEKDTLLIAR